MPRGRIWKKSKFIEEDYKSDLTSILDYYKEKGYRDARIVMDTVIIDKKNIDLNIPRNKLVVITGVSGSGKSSLAFDTIYSEAQRRYIETFSAYARQYIGGLKKPDVDKIDGLSPVIAIEQKTTTKNL